MKAANVIVRLMGIVLVACFTLIGYKEITKRLPLSESASTDSAVSSQSSGNSGRVPASRPNKPAPNGPSWSSNPEWDVQRQQAQRESAERAAIETQEREDRANRMREEREARLRDEAHEAAMEQMRERERQRRARFDEPRQRQSSSSDGMSLDVADNPFNLDNPNPQPAAPQDPGLSAAERRVERLRQSAYDCSVAQRYPNTYRTQGCEGIEERLRQAEEALRQSQRY